MINQTDLTNIGIEKIVPVYKAPTTTASKKGQMHATVPLFVERLFPHFEPMIWVIMEQPYCCTKAKPLLTKSRHMVKKFKTKMRWHVKFEKSRHELIYLL